MRNIEGNRGSDGDLKRSTEYYFIGRKGPQNRDMGSDSSVSLFRLTYETKVDDSTTS